MATQYQNGIAGHYEAQDIPDEYGFPTGNTKQVFVYDEPGSYQTQDVLDEYGFPTGNTKQVFVPKNPTAVEAPPLKADARTISTFTPVIDNSNQSEYGAPDLRGYTGIFKDASGDSVLATYLPDGSLVSTMKQVGGTQYTYSPTGKLIGQQNVGGSGGLFGGISSLLTSDLVKTMAPMVLTGGLGGAAGVGQMLGTNALVGGAALGAGTAALTGQDILKGAALGGIGGAGQGLSADIGGALGAGKDMAPILGGAVLGGGMSALTGQNIGTGALLGGLTNAGGVKIGDTGVNLGEVGAAAKVLDNIDKGNLLGAITSAANLTGTGNTKIGDTGLTINDLSKDINLAKAVISGNPQLVTNALTSVANSAAKSENDVNTAINPYFQTGAGTGALPSTDTAPTENTPAPEPFVAPTEAPIENTPAPEVPVGGLPTTDATNTNQTPEASPLTTVGMTPEETKATDWAALYAQPTTNPATGETITGGDVSQYPVQNFGDSAAKQIENGTINVGSGGFTSGWQTSGSDRIMIQDDGTAIGINENGDSYSLSPEEVKKMVENGQLNTKESGYVSATGGTGNLPGGSGVVTTPSNTTTPSKTTSSSSVSSPSAPATSKTNPFGVLPLDSSPQMLTSTMPTGQSAKMAELHQLFNSLTPEMRDVFSSKGISPGSEMTTAASGGLISDETSKILDSLNPKYITAPTHLQSSMPQQLEPRLGALRHLAQGPLKTSGLSNRMSSGGLPHKYAEAAPEGHHPEFITGVTGYYAQGGGTGQSDDIPAMLHDGDFVMDADTVASLGDGSSKAGAEVLEKMRKQVPHQDHAAGSPVPAKIADGEYVFPASFVTAIGGGSNKVGSERLNEMREKIRAHKRSAPTTKIPPKAKSPLDYLKMAKG